MNVNAWLRIERQIFIDLDNVFCFSSIHRPNRDTILFYFSFYTALLFKTALRGSYRWYLIYVDDSKWAEGIHFVFFFSSSLFVCRSSFDESSDFRRSKHWLNLMFLFRFVLTWIARFEFDWSIFFIDSVLFLWKTFWQFDYLVLKNHRRFFRLNCFDEMSEFKMTLRANRLQFAFWFSAKYAKMHLELDVIDFWYSGIQIVLWLPFHLNFRF